MRANKDDQQTGKLQYVRPDLVERGSIAELTQQEPKTLGGSDGIFLLNDDNPLGNVS